MVKWAKYGIKLQAIPGVEVVAFYDPSILKEQLEKRITQIKL